MAIRGSCLCGAVSFEIDKAVGPMELCHCTHCRKTSGANGLMTIGVNTRDYHFLTGEADVNVYAAPIVQSSPNYQSCFCTQCGSPVHLPSQKVTGSKSLRAA